MKLNWLCLRWNGSLAVCVCMCGGSRLDMFRDALWAGGSQQLPYHFTGLTWWWWIRRAQTGMSDIWLILHLPYPEKEALFISVRLFICVWGSQHMLFSEPHLCVSDSQRFYRDLLLFAFIFFVFRTFFLNKHCLYLPCLMLPVGLAFFLWFNN